MKRIAGLALAASLAVTTMTSVASAQSWKIGATGQLGLGLEGNGQENGGPRPAPMRVRLGADLRVDEFPTDIIAFGIDLNVTPHTSVGADLRYVKELGKKFDVNIGGIAYVAPATLFGPSAGLVYKLPLGTDTAFTVGPEINVFCLGSDLPDGTVIWQGLIQAGFHADL